MCSGRHVEYVEKLLFEEFQKVPFHNLFFLNNIQSENPGLGGTCSDKVLHFQEVLKKNGIESFLHTAFINNQECHRMLMLDVDGVLYLADVGSGWPSWQLFPVSTPHSYKVFNMGFRTEVHVDHLLLFQKLELTEKCIEVIPFQRRKEEEIIRQIENRFSDVSIYPFKNSLRFSLIHKGIFYFLRGNNLFIYSRKNTSIHKNLSKSEVYYLVNDRFKFDLNGLEYYFPSLSLPPNLGQ